MTAMNLDLSVVLIIVMVWALYFVLKKSFFDPINKILDERDAATNGAQREAQAQIRQFEAKSRSYEEALKAARLENYRQQEAFRTEAMRGRTQILAEGRQQAEVLIAAAKQDIQTQVATAKHALKSEVDTFADGIVKAVLR